MRRLMSLDTRMTRASLCSVCSASVCARMMLSPPWPGRPSGSTLESCRVWKNSRPVEGFLPWLPEYSLGSCSPRSICSLVTSRIMSSRKRLTWRTLREASDRPFLCASSSSSTTIGRYTSCSSKRKMAVGSCMSTLVSSMNRRLPVRDRPFISRDSPEAAVGPGSETLRCFKHFLRVTGDLHLAPFLPHPSGAIQQEGATFHPQVLSAVQAFLFDDIKEFADFFVRVGEQRKGQ